MSKIMANHSWDNPQSEGQLRTTFSPLECITWLAVLCTIGIATVTVNGLAVIVYLKEPSLRKRSMYLVISLAIADLCIGGISLSKDVFDSGHKCNLWKSHLSSAGKRILIAVYWLFPVASVTNLAVISLERMHATFRPFKHRLIKKWIFGASAAFVWFTAVLNSSTCMYLYAQGVLRKSSFAPLSILACCLCIILVSYASIVVKMYCGTRPYHHGAGSRERKLTTTLFIVTILSLALLLPYILSFYFRTVLPSHLGMFFACLAYANSLVNPILYVYRIPEFKRAMSSFLGCRPRAQVFPQ